MCRASSPVSCDILEVLKKQDVTNFIPLRLPCVGRVPLEFYLQAQLIGIKKIIVIQCDDASCRCKKGSENSTNNLARLKSLMKGFGYEGDLLTQIKNPPKAVYHTEICVGCDKCVFICPYEAIEARPLATPAINLEKCRGCGACALVCPHLAIQLQGFEYEPSSQMIQKYKTEAESKTKDTSPLVLVFCCQWAEYSALDRVKDGFLKDNAVIVEVPCFNGLDPVQVIEAFNSGFSGVLAVVCSDDDCKLEEGRQAAKQNASVLLKSLEKLNLTDRFEICNTSPRNMGEFDSKVESFIEKISSLPKIKAGGD
jgi:coenzyme F420-reducing hydrogenase delta subunit/Pyruvate/2-oxoacid:ferredoxin oxidoreductase delta subunit